MYGVGSYYARHIDQFKGDDARQFSMITYLNTDWEGTDGGELVLYLPDRDQVILPKGGRTVFFRANEIEHEVKVARKDRYSITGWLKG